MCGEGMVCPLGDLVPEKALYCSEYVPLQDAARDLENELSLLNDDTPEPWYGVEMLSMLDCR
jgi:hypothetical protein